MCPLGHWSAVSQCIVSVYQYHYDKGQLVFSTCDTDEVGCSRGATQLRKPTLGPGDPKVTPIPP